MKGMKQIDAGVLNVGYAEAGPTDGPPVILLHGWPYDIHGYVDVSSILSVYHEGFLIYLCGLAHLLLYHTPPSDRDMQLSLRNSRTRRTRRERGRRWAATIHPAGSRSSCCLIASRFVDRHIGSASLSR